RSPLHCFAYLGWSKRSITVASVASNLPSEAGRVMLAGHRGGRMQAFLVRGWPGPQRRWGPVGWSHLDASSPNLSSSRTPAGTRARGDPTGGVWSVTIAAGQPPLPCHHLPTRGPRRWLLEDFPVHPHYMPEGRGSRRAIQCLPRAGPARRARLPHDPADGG